MSDKSTKEIAADAGVKVVLGLTAIFLLKKAITSAFSEPGLTTRVKFDYPNTQIRKISLGGDQWHIVNDPWKPDTLAHELHSVMLGIETSEYTLGEKRKPAWEAVSQLAIDRARGVHNYWLDNVDPDDTVWRWINEEWANYPEWDAKDAAMNMLTRAGVGW